MAGSRMNPEISVIVPVYKVEPYLDRCMQSLLGQTFSNFEILLVDDGSPDGCPAMCDAYARQDPRVHVIHKKNAGLGFARNSGLEIATGEYVAFVDSDDYVTTDMMEKLLAEARETGADAVYGGIYYHRPEGITVAPGPKERRIWRGAAEVRELLLDQVATKPGRTRDTVMEVSVWRALFRRQVLEDHQIRFVSERQFISEDVVFDIDFLQWCQCVSVLPDPVYYYCTNQGSLTKTFREDRFQKAVQLYQELGRRLAPLFPQEEYTPRCSRFLIARARRSAMSVLAQKKTAGRGQVRQWLAQICTNPDLQQVLATYPIQKLPYQQFAAALAMKHRWYGMLDLLASLRKWKR